MGTTWARGTACRRPASPRPRPWAPRSTWTWSAGWARRSATRPAPRASPWCSGRESTSSGPRCAGATSNTCPRTRWCRGSSGPHWSTASRAGASGPRSSTSPSTTRRRTGCGSVPWWTSGHCARSTWPGSSACVRTVQPWTVMCSYNRVNGVYASEDPWLLTDGAARRVAVRRPGHVGLGRGGRPGGRRGRRPRPRDAVVPRGRTGTGGGRRRLGELDESVVDRAAGRLLRLLDRATVGDRVRRRFDEDGHHELARSVAAECAVLLTNDRGLLPLTDDLARVAVVGEFARSPRFQGAGSSKVNPTRVDDALGALRAPPRRRPPRSDSPPGSGWTTRRPTTRPCGPRPWRSPTGADVVLVFLGLPPSFESEGFDRDHMDLPVGQCPTARGGRRA